MESYFGDFTESSLWYWASAGKPSPLLPLVLHRQKGNDGWQIQMADYLGEGWTTASPEKEQKIRIADQLRMTTGPDYNISECTLPNCLQFKADPGTRWAYHTGPYTLLQTVVAERFRRIQPLF